MTEQKLTAAILDAIRSMGHPAWRNNTGVTRVGKRFIRFGLGVGSADVIAVVRGRFVGIEVKMPHATKRPHEAQQETWRSQVTSAGGYCAVVRSVDEAVVAIRDAERGWAA